MRAVTLFACVALIAAASTVHATTEEDPCVGEVLRCRDEICAGRQVLQNKCESGEGNFMKSCSCGGPLVEQQSGGSSLLGQAVEALEARLDGQEEAAQAAQDTTTQKQEKEMDCDEMMTEGGEKGEQQQQTQTSTATVTATESGTESERPPLGGFTFRFNLGRRFGPQGEQQPRVRFVRPSASSPLSSLGFSPFGSIFSGVDGSDYADSFFDAGLGGSLFDSLFGPSSRPAIPVARQQFLLGAPSFMTRRVFYPDVQAQAQSSRFQQPAVTMRLATPQDLEALGLNDKDYNNNNNAASAAAAAISPLGEQLQQRAAKRKAVTNAVERWKTAAGVQRADVMRPMPPVRLAAIPAGKVPVVPVAPDGANADADADAEPRGERAWYEGYRARRALFCVASIALVMAIIALNAALLMCCASACCRGFGQSDAKEDFTIDSVAATTPLLVEYEVERVAKPGYEHMSEEEMIVVHHASMAPMPREGKAAH